MAAQPAAGRSMPPGAQDAHRPSLDQPQRNAGPALQRREGVVTRLDLLSIAADRELRLEAHRVLRCLEDRLSFDSYTAIDTRAIAEILEMRPQAVSRALRILSERHIIARGVSKGRSSTFRFATDVVKPGNPAANAELRSAVETDLDGLARGGSFTASYGRDDLRRDIAGGRCWVLQDEGAIIGQLSIRKDPSIEMSYLLARLMVDRRYRRCGLGSRLVAAMEQSLEGNRIHAYCAISDSECLKFLVYAGFALSGYVKGRHEADTRLFFGKIAQAAPSLADTPLSEVAN
ncbi:MAG: GNAT family N-acetyltransferase [Aliidongia sp.]